MSLCENNCNYTKYDGNSKQSSCDCNIKNKMGTISDILEQQNDLPNNFANDKSGSSGSSNIISIKCTKTLFSKDGLKNNISSYILIIFIAYILLSIILFIKCGYKLLLKQIDDIIKEKEKIKNEMAKNNQLENRQTTINRRKPKKNYYNKKKGNFPPKKTKANLGKNNNKINLLRRNNKINKSNNIIQLGRLSNLNSNNKKIIRSNRNLSYNIHNYLNNKSNKNGTNLTSNQKRKKNNVKITYNDYELNTFEYIKAVECDKRSCLDYYISLLKRKNLIVFSFCPIKDYNSIIIKSCIFCISFSIYYAINFAFFNNEIMHEIYNVGGKYDIIYFIPKITISFFAGYYITTILKLIFLSEGNIIQVRQEILPNSASNVSDKVRKNLVIKYTLFFILSLIFLGFFWMLLSSFGAVYPNTQMFIFKNTLISFAMSLIYPFFFNVFPCIFRMLSLKSKDSEYAYKISKYIQILWNDMIVEICF